jgi:cytochrome P450
VVLTYDPTDPTVLRDPHATFAELRRNDPVHWEETLSAWVVTEYDLVEEIVVTSSKERFSANRMGPFVDRLPEPERSHAAEVNRWLSLWMLLQDRPEHTRLRKHLSRVINARVVGDLDAMVTDVARVLLDDVPVDEPFDFLKAVGLELPGMVVLSVLGVPLTHSREVNGWADDLMLFLGSARGVSRSVKYERAARGTDGLVGLFSTIIEERRREPREDVVSKLIASEINEDKLTDDELIASMIMLGNGAQVTTAHLFSNSLMALLDHPDALAELRAEPDLMASAVEEFLRYDGPVLSVGRLIARDTELGGTEMHEGERVFAMLTAANRDPEKFSDPDDLDLRRFPNRHLAFGKGAHFCLGAPLARLEVQIGLREMFDRFGTFEITEPLENIPWTDNMTSRGPVRLPMRVTR